MGEGFTIRIFVLDGDPQGIRLIDRMNWRGEMLGRRYTTLDKLLKAKKLTDVF